MKTKWHKKGKLTIGEKDIHCYKTPCYTCKTTGKVKNKKCGSCQGTGIYTDKYYFHVVKINGKKVCFGGDTIK